MPGTSHRTIITAIQSILPLFYTNMRHGINQKQTTNTNLVFTNKFASTLTNNREQIKQIGRLRNGRWISSWESIVDLLDQQFNNNNKKKKKSKNGMILLVGNPHTAIAQKLLSTNSMHSKKIITLQQMCALFPEKVPLSYRTKNNKQLKQKIQKRINGNENKETSKQIKNKGFNLTKQPHIGAILYTGSIPMWDQAIQVVIDHQEPDVVNIVEYDAGDAKDRGPLQNGDEQQLFRLGMSDFIKSVIKCHKLVHNKQLPNLLDLNSNNAYVQWLINKVAGPVPNASSNAQTLIIDQELVNDREALLRKYGYLNMIQIQRVDENSSLWV